MSSSGGGGTTGREGGLHTCQEQANKQTAWDAELMQDTQQ